MAHSHRIKSSIGNSILQFKERKIDYIGLLEDLYGNINALDNIDKRIKSALITLGAEMESIYYMHSPEKHYQYMLKEIEKFENIMHKFWP
jgi:hypothetical protein